MRKIEWNLASRTVVAMLISAGLAVMPDGATRAQQAPKITIDASPGVKVEKVDPKLVIGKGKKKGTLVVEVTVRNTGDSPRRFIAFAGGVVEGGQLSGRNLIPKKGMLGPNEVGKAKIKTKYKGAALPAEVVVEVGPCLFGPGC